MTSFLEQFTKLDPRGKNLEELTRLSLALGQIRDTKSSSTQATIEALLARITYLANALSLNT